MDKIEFHKRKAESNIRSIKLMHRGNCVKTIEFSEYQLFRILLDIGKMLDRGDSKETISDYVLPYINLHSAEEEISLDDLIPDNIEEVEKYKDLLEQTEKSNRRQANTIKKLTEKNQELETKVTEKDKIIKDLKNKKVLNEASKKTTRGRGKSKKTADDIDIDEILEEGLN